MISLTCEILKKNTNELIYRIETDSQTLKNLWLPKETGERGGINWWFGVGICTLRSMEQLAIRDLLYSTGNSTQ